MEPWDDRGQSIQIGAVLIFAALILLLSLYQATIVPQQNEQVEFDHSQQVRGDLLDLRNAVTSTVGESASRSVSIQLGTTYPSRVLAVNPPPVSGLLRTAGTADGDVNFTLSNAVALDNETDDFWDGSADSGGRYQTGSLVYRPSYNEYGQPPRTVYDSTVLYDNFTFEGATIARSGQTLIDGSTISLVALNGSLQQSSSGAASVDVRPKSASSTTVAVRDSAAGNITIRTATRLPNSTWTELLADEANVTGWETSPLSVDGFRTVEIELVPGTYELRMAKAGVGTRVTDTDAAYMTDVAADGSTVPEDGSVRLTLEVRDAYNNPVAGVNVTGESQEVANGTLNETEVATGDDGRATFQFEAESVNTSADVPVEFNFTLPDSSPTPFDPDDPEDVEVVVRVQNTQVPEGSGGGGGAGYSLEWTDAGTVPGPTTGTSSEVCATGSGVDPCSVVMQSETSDAQIGAPVGFGSNDTALVRVLDRANATTSDGTARTTVRFERAEGNATLWTQSAGANATRIVSTPSYSSFDSDLGEWGEFGSFQGTGVSRTSGESNSGDAVVLPGGNDGGIVTTGYDTTDAELVVFQYWIKESDTGDVGDGNGDISVEYRDSGGDWVTVDSQALTGTSPGALRTVRLGSGAIHDDLAIRFEQTNADTANDEWVIDDPQISVIGEAVGGGGPGGGGNQPPSASFTVSDSNPDVGQTVTFDASGPSGSNDPDGSIVSYNWDFGDGATDSGSTPTHAYGSTGSYTVTLTATDDDGATDTATQTVSVGTSNQPPTADAGPDETVEEGNSVGLDGTGSTDSDGTVTGYAWTITSGQGSLSDANTETPTYNAPADVSGDQSVTVELEVTDDDGATDTDTLTITVEDVAGQAIQFSNIQGFTADPSANEFTLDQVQVQDADSDDDLDRIEYVVTDGDGNTVATRTVTGIGPAQYQPSGTPAVTIAADDPVVGGETYTLTATAYDADGNSASRSRSDTTSTPTATTVTPTAFNDRDNDNPETGESEALPPGPDESGDLANFANLASEDGSTATIEDGGQTTNVGLELYGITTTADDYRVEIGYTKEGYSGAGTMDVVLVDAQGTELQRESLRNTGEPEELAFTVNDAAEAAIADTGSVFLVFEKTGGGYARTSVDYVRATALTDGNARDGGPPSATVTSVTTGNCNNGNGGGYCVSWDGSDPNGDFTEVTTIIEDASGTDLSTETTTFGPTGSNTGDQRHTGVGGSAAQVRVIARDANGNELVFTRPIP
ncbi:PKD domain-containing protein [Halosimplex litoreum]|uniref:PKD domain-containing protein n=1 Tax=Halosimplex litoreum TaxID=1198301 RepID=A0A7T3KUD4_9EURY|nr:PKD domain-containing protein [Halosimplex litoreum]QPV61974.1 PKD domain-containing protein [Halosimplex litoreum]